GMAAAAPAGSVSGVIASIAVEGASSSAAASWSAVRSALQATRVRLSDRRAAAGSRRMHVAPGGGGHRLRQNVFAAVYTQGGPPDSRPQRGVAARGLAASAAAV